MGDIDPVLLSGSEEEWSLSILVSGASLLRFFLFIQGTCMPTCPSKQHSAWKTHLATTMAARVLGAASFWKWCLGMGLGWGRGRLVWGYAGVWARDGVGGRLAYGGSAVACARGGVVGKLAWGDKRNDACIGNGKMVLPCRVTEHLPHVLYSVASLSYS